MFYIAAKNLGDKSKLLLLLKMTDKARLLPILHSNQIIVDLQI